MKTALWDIESSDLKPAFGVMLCAGIKEVGKKSKILKKGRAGSNDRELLVAVRNELEKYDILIGFYTLGFDRKFLNARLLRWGERPLERKLHIDVYRIVAKNFPNTSSRSLGAIT